MDRVAEITSEWNAVMAVMRAAYELGMSGDPYETTDPEQIKLRLALVDACADADKIIRALAAQADAAEGMDTLLRSIYESALRFKPSHPPILSLQHFLELEAHVRATAPADGTEAQPAPEMQQNVTESDTSEMPR